MSALLLLFLSIGLGNVLRLLFIYVPDFIQLLLVLAFRTKFGAVVFLLPIAVPVAAIAIAHHVLHVVLDRLDPEASTSETSRIKLVFPTVLSWWEGLYGWLTLSLASFISLVILRLFSVSEPSGFSNSIGLLQWEWISYLAGILVWVTIAAYFYQFEYAFRQRLIASGRES